MTNKFWVHDGCVPKMFDFGIGMRFFSYDGLDLTISVYDCKILGFGQQIKMFTVSVPGSRWSGTWTIFLICHWFPFWSLKVEKPGKLWKCITSTYLFPAAISTTQRQHFQVFGTNVRSHWWGALVKREIRKVIKKPLCQQTWSDFCWQ